MTLASQATAVVVNQLALDTPPGGGVVTREVSSLLSLARFPGVFLKAFLRRSIVPRGLFGYVTALFGCAAFDHSSKRHAYGFPVYGLTLEP